MNVKGLQTFYLQTEQVLSVLATFTFWCDFFNHSVEQGKSAAGLLRSSSYVDALVLLI